MPTATRTLTDRDWARVEQEFLDADRPRHVVLDDFLDPATLTHLQQALAADTRWSVPHDGSATAYLPSPDTATLSRVAEDLAAAMPRVLGGLALVDHWALRYLRSEGLHAHTDTGSVTVNFYVTPDRFNLGPGGGGLVLTRAQRPAELSPFEYNSLPWSYDLFRRLDDGTRIPVAYRCNRAVVFDSRTFHASDAFTFADTDDSTRRANVGLIFDDADAPAARRAEFVATVEAMAAAADAAGVPLSEASLERVEQLWQHARADGSP